MIYLDLGCHNGQSIIDFYDGKFDDRLEPKFFKSIAFDPNPHYKDELDRISNILGTEIIKKAVLDHNGTIEFSLRSNDEKSSVMKEKNCWADGEIMTVPCIDFAEYLYNLGEDVVIRMDIEGAEYPVLERLIMTGVIKQVKYLGIEWHASKMSGNYQERQQKIEKKLKELGIYYKNIV